MKTFISVAILTLASSSATAANCAKNPNHSSCQGGVRYIDTSALPTVVNGDTDKTIIGKAFKVDWEVVPMSFTNPGSGGYRYRAYADVRLSKQVLSGENIGYTLRFYSNDEGISVGVGGYTANPIWNDPGCNGIPDAIQFSSNQSHMNPIPQLFPFFSNEYIAVQYGTSSGVNISLLRVGNPVGGGFIGYKFFNGSCGSTNYPSEGGLPVSEGYDLINDYVAPITFVPTAP